MRTAAAYRTKDFYFGRTPDYWISCKARIVITPGRYVFDLRSPPRRGTGARGKDCPAPLTRVWLPALFPEKTL